MIGWSTTAATVTVSTNTTIGTGDGSLDGSDLVVAGCVLTLDGVHRFSSVTLKSGAVMTHSAATAESVRSLQLEISGDLAVEAGSRLDVSGRGYLGGRTVGNTTTGGATGASGGSYGGLGYGGGANAVYGDYRNPNEVGSGGGLDWGQAGAGGGLVRIAANRALIDGELRADGAHAGDLPSGSGGGVRLDVNVLAGGGLISAVGGSTGGNAPGTGGGGRVALYYGRTEGFDVMLRVRAHGGSKWNGLHGAPGTVYLKQAGQAGLLRIDSFGVTPWNGTPTPLGVAGDSKFVVERLEVAGRGVVVRPEHQMPVEAGEVVLSAESTMTHLPTTSEREYSLLLTAGVLNVQAGCRIDVSARGHGGGKTVGNVSEGGATGASGGSYGGMGAGGSGNRVYGDYRNPNELGSGGGVEWGSAGAGGGLARIVAETAVIDGEIRADGQDMSDVPSGSGGGIRLDVGTLSGSGLIIARGGGTGGNAPRCGGGGRVAIYYATVSGLDLTNQVKAHGGAKWNGLNGAPGTVYLKPRNGQELLRIDTYGVPPRDGAYTPLGVASDSSFRVDRLQLVGGELLVKPEHPMEVDATECQITDGAVLTHLPFSLRGETGLLLKFGDLAVGKGSRIDVSALGYPRGTTWGTNLAPAQGAAGGSYGGLGAGAGANRVYGDFRDPNELGSGGGLEWGDAGAGGGLLRLVALRAVIDGEIRADGQDMSDVPSGSGGAIRLDVGELKGEGLISARGGGTGGNAPRCGGGGRIAVYYGSSSLDLTNQVKAPGGAKWNGLNGAPGTVYLKPQIGMELVRVDTQGVPPGDGAWTPLGIWSDALFEAGKVQVVGNALLVMPEHQLPVKVSELQLTAGTRLAHLPTTSGETRWLELEAQSLVVEEGAVIDADGRGYLAGVTMGNTDVGGARGAAGGSYGGLGAGSGANAVYGDYRDPSHPGSGGGTEWGAAGSGGGLLRLKVERAVVDGIIRANGGPGSGGYPGGSGGGLRLDVARLRGKGLITAHGGSADGNSPSAGGGGRVAIYYGGLEGFDVLSQVQARGGDKWNGLRGAPGTVYLKPADQTGLLRIDSFGFYPGNGAWTPLGVPTNTVFRAERVEVVGAGVIVAAEHLMPLELLELSLGAGTVLTHGTTTTAREESLQLTAREVRVMKDARIDASGLGYRGGYTLGNSTASAASGASGGSYGGRGYGNGANVVYGDYRDPRELGSGGGMEWGAAGAGGGLIRLVADHLHVDGEIRADGGSVGDYPGGSGGGIRIDAGVLGGSGLIAARGAGVGGNAPGCGGGGRAAIYFATLDGFDPSSQVRVHGGVKWNGLNGAPGSVYFKAAGQPGTLRIDTFGNHPGGGTWTPLGLPGDRVVRGERLEIAGPNLVVIPQRSIPIELDSLALLGGAVLTHDAATATETFGLYLTLTNELRIDAASRIDVSGRGYVANRTQGNTNVGAATGRAGGSYGGLGSDFGGSPGEVYGDAESPWLPGAGGGGASGYRGGSGGGLARITAGRVVLEGAILANGQDGDGGGGAGGGILINASDVTGSGTVTANGGSGYACGGGGGGRVAVYAWKPSGELGVSLKADGGNGWGNPSRTGTVVVVTGPRFTWNEPKAEFLHGREVLSWSGQGFNPSGVTVEVLAHQSGSERYLGNRLPVHGSIEWDTTAAVDGIYELKAVFRESSGGVLGEATRRVRVNNSVVWHGGGIAQSETWESGQVHVVENDVVIESGAVVMIQPGAVVKMVSGRRLIVSSGGTLNARGVADLNVVMTTLTDDSAGGDTNMDGRGTRPLPGDWAGIQLAVGGTFDYNEFTETRYVRTQHGGTVAKSETWMGTFMHEVIEDVVVASGATLTIGPGAAVKFGLGKGLVVQSGGQLRAEGTPALPVIFTSIRDDAVGGDTNGDGDATKPEAGDWRWILLEGSEAVFAHARLSYGGGPAEGGWGPPGGPGKAMIKTSGSASLSVSNSVLSEAFYDGILAWGGPVRIVNSVLTGIDRAVCAHPGSAVEVLNCTLSSNRVGLLIHGGSMAATNTIVAHSISSGVLHDYGADALSMASCDLWNPSATDGNFTGTADLTGVNGNFSLDPKFRNAGRGNVRLGYQSPCVDAGDGRVAPVTDIMGAPRYDDPRSANTGTEGSGGRWADVGAYEFVESAPSDLDLVIDWVEGPVRMTAGEEVTVRWQVSNTGTGRARGPWHDTVSLVADAPQRGVDVIVLDEVLTRGTLGPGETLFAEAKLRVPGGTQGSWRWRVTANTGGEVFEGRNWENNLSGVSFPSQLVVPALKVDAPLAATYGGSGKPAWYRVEQSAGMDLAVVLDSAVEQGRVRLYAGFGSMPTESSFDVRNREWNSVDARLGIPAANSARDLYLLVVPEVLGGDARNYTLTASTAAFTLDAVGVRQVGNAGRSTVPLLGSGFRAGLAASLESADGRVKVPSSEVWIEDSANAMAAFPLQGAPVGRYDVVVQQQGATARLRLALEVREGFGPRFDATLWLPKQVRVGRPFQATIEFANVGDADLPVPLIYVQNSAGNPMWFGPKDQPGTDTLLQFLAMAPDGPSHGVLRPDERHTIPFNSRLSANGEVSYTAHWVPGDSPQSMNWASLKAVVKPESAGADWDTAWDAMVSAAGKTVGDYVAALTMAADDVRQRRQESPDLVGLVAYLVDQRRLDASEGVVSGSLYRTGTQVPLPETLVVLRGVSYPASYSVLSTATGAFAFDGVLPGEYDLVVGDYLPAPAARVWAPLTKPLALYLDEGGRLQGQVMSRESGQPVAGATVGAFDLQQRSMHTAESDEGGYYVVKGLAASSFLVTVSAPGFMATTGQTLQVQEGVATTYSPYLERGGSVHGVVVDPRGQAAPGADVRLVSTRSLVVVSTVSGAEGQFHLEGVESGVYRLVALRAGAGPGALSSVSVSRGQSVEGLRVTLSTPGTVSGVVVDARTGQAVANAVVGTEATLPDDRPILTDASGRFVLSDVPEGSWDVWAQAQGYVQQTVRVNVPGGGTANVSLGMRTGGVMVGQVLDSGGAPLSGMRVTVASTNGALQVLVAGADGGFRVDGLPDGGYMAAVGSPVGMGVGRADVSLSEAAPVADVNLRVAGVQVRGRLVQADGSTMTGAARVALMREGRLTASTLIDGQGSYRFLVMEPGVFDVVAAGASWGLGVQAGVTVGSSGIVTIPDLRPGGGNLELLVAEVSTGTAISNAVVHLDWVSADPAELGLWAHTDGQGMARFGALAPGSYRVNVTADGRVALPRVVNINTGQNRLTVAVDAGRRVEGVVTFADGTPAAGAQVTAVETESGWMGRTTTGADGSYRLNSVPSRAIDLWAYDGRHLPAARLGLNVPTSVTLRADLVLKPMGSRVRGRVLDGDGRVMPFARVEVIQGQGSGEGMLVGWSDALGVYELGFVDGGPTRIRAVADGFVPVVSAVETSSSSGSDAVLDLRLGKPVAMAWMPGGSSAGRLDYASGLRVVPWANLEAGEDTAVQGWQRQGLRDWWNSTSDYWTTYPKPSRLSEDTDAWRLGFRSYPPPDPACGYASKRYAEVLRDANSSLRSVEQNYLAWVSAHEALKEANKANLGLVGAQTTKLTSKLALFVLSLESTAAYLSGYGVVAGEAEMVSLAVSTIGLLQNVVVNTINALNDKDFDRAQAGFESMVDLLTDLGDRVVGSPLYGPIWLLGSSIKDIRETWQDASAGLRDNAAMIANYTRSRDAYIGAQVRHWANQNTLAAVSRLTCPGAKQPPPVPPGGLASGSGRTSGVGSWDPNDKLTIGYGSKGYIAAGTRLLYTIRFENKNTATAPAQRVTITDTLDPRLDWSTFELVAFGFNLVELKAPAGLNHYTTESRVATDPGNDVQVTGVLDPDTGVASWLMESIDPVTGEAPEDPLAGFLPPNDSQKRGEGFVSYSIVVKTNLASGTTITNWARIVFDYNPPIDTPPVVNSLDTAAPASAVEALAAMSPARFEVRWSGADGESGAGIAAYDLLVSVNGGAYETWITGSTNTSAFFTGQPDNTYQFISVARDHVGNGEPMPTVADAVTQTGFELQVDRLEPQLDGQSVRVTLVWQSVPNRVFDVLWSPGLGAPWSKVGTSLSSTPPLNQFTTVVKSQPTGFFRLEVRSAGAP